MLGPAVDRSQFPVDVDHLSLPDFVSGVVDTLGRVCSVLRGGWEREPLDSRTIAWANSEVACMVAYLAGIMNDPKVVALALQNSTQAVIHMLEGRTKAVTIH